MFVHLSGMNFLWRVSIIFWYLLISEFSYFSYWSYRRGYCTIFFLFSPNTPPWLILSFKEMKRERFYHITLQFLRFSTCIPGRKDYQGNIRIMIWNTRMDRMMRPQSCSLYMTHSLKCAWFRRSNFCLYYLKYLVSRSYLSSKDPQKNILKRSAFLTISLNRLVSGSSFLRQYTLIPKCEYINVNENISTLEEKIL